MIAITGATGQLGRLVIDQLLQKTAATEIVAVVRSPAKAAELAARGVVVRAANYDAPDALRQAFAGVDKVLLISSNEIGRRLAQHQNVIAAAKHAKVNLLVFTSLLHADTSPLNLAPEYLATEQAIAAARIPRIILRNGWYSENYAASIPSAVAHGAFPGSAGEGRIASAARADYAAAAVAALTGKAAAGRTYELAGDTAYRLTDLAAEISRQSGQAIPYHNLPEAAYRDILIKAGLPPALASNLASWDTCASAGALFDDGHELSQLIGRATTPISATVAHALKP